MTQEDYKEKLFSSNEAVAATTLLAELDSRACELLDCETTLNEKIDTNLRNNIDREPRAVWYLYAFQFIAVTAFALALKVIQTDAGFVCFASFLGASLSDSRLGTWEAQLR
ncbi:hypothetical protein BGZ73_001556, partial [Actinomortierella ambigua]